MLRAGPAGSGARSVKSKVHRLGIARPGFAGAVESDGLLALLGRHSVEHEHSVEMVDFVLEETRQEFVGLELHVVAVEIDSLHDDSSRAQHLDVQAGNRQTSLVVHPLPARFDDLRVDDDARIFVDVVDEETALDADLRRRETDSGRLVHDTEHFLGETNELAVDVRDFVGNGLQHRITEGTDVVRHVCKATNDVNTPPERPTDAKDGTGGTGDHYFSARPTSPRNTEARFAAVRVKGIEWELALDRGVFNGGDLDWGTRVLLENAPPPPPGGTFCDLGCGSGAIATYLARLRPDASIWAVEVNERAREVARMTMACNDVTNVTVVDESGVPADVRFDLLWSNPPIRVGKDELHRLLATWLARLAPAGVACLVAHKNLGSDSLARWLTSQGWNVERHSSKQGYRVLVVRR